MASSRDISRTTRFQTVTATANGDVRTSFSYENANSPNASEASPLDFYNKLFGPTYQDPNNATFYHFSDLVAKLNSHATSASDQLAVQSLSSDPTGGGNFQFSRAEAKALGLEGVAGPLKEDRFALSDHGPHRKPDGRGNGDRRRAKGQEQCRLQGTVALVGHIGHHFNLASFGWAGAIVVRLAWKRIWKRSTSRCGSRVTGEANATLTNWLERDSSAISSDALDDWPSI